MVFGGGGDPAICQAVTRASLHQVLGQMTEPDSIASPSSRLFEIRGCVNQILIGKTPRLGLPGPTYTSDIW